MRIRNTINEYNLLAVFITMTILASREKGQL